MKKKIGLVFVMMLIFLMLGTTVLATEKLIITNIYQFVWVDGVNRFDLEGFNIKGHNYFKLRDIAACLSGTRSQFSVNWCEDFVEITTGEPFFVPEEVRNYHYFQEYVARPVSTRLLIDGEFKEVAAYHINGHHYYQLRDLEKLIPFMVVWDQKYELILIFSTLPANATWAEVKYRPEDNYLTASFPRWSQENYSYLLGNGDGTISVLEFNKEEEIKVATLETYNARYELQNRKRITYELPLFGGFYSGEKYNYIAFGQENWEEDDQKEVIRIVRYNKNFKRIDSVSIKGGESFTIVPFAASWGQMAEKEDTLIFHTSRTRYTVDGVNHQSQLTIILDTARMVVTNNLGEFQENHVSHSFAQYVLFDGSDCVFLDHGDAYPRSIVLSKDDKITCQRISKCQTDLFEIPGEIGANCTGVLLGGFEMSTTNYLVAMNTIDHSQVSEYTSLEMVGLKEDQRDILICTCPRGKDKYPIGQITHAKYVGSKKVGSVPKLVKITNERFVLLWQEFEQEQREFSSVLKYLYIDENGEAIGEIQTLEDVILSDCQPLLIDNRLVWYTNRAGFRTFYEIPLI